MCRQMTLKIVLLFLAINWINAKTLNWSCVEETCSTFGVQDICDITDFCGCVALNSDVCNNQTSQQVNGTLSLEITKRGSLLSVRPFQWSGDYRHINLVKFFLDIATSITSIQSVSVTNFCQYSDALQFNENRAVNLNLTAIQQNLQISELTLTENCISAIFGSFSEVFPYLTSLILSNNDLQNLSKDILKNLSYLESLHLTNNSLHFIEDLAFQGLPRLDILLLTSNKLTFLPSTMFHHSPRLTKLSLSDNYIESLPQNIFQHSNNIYVLLLNSNRLRNVSLKTFETLTKLMKFNLSSNNLAFIDEKLFAGLHSLVVLDISNNSFMKPLNKTSFQHLKKFTSLQMSFNLLQEIPEFILPTPSFPQFQIVNLSNNKINNMTLPLRNQLKKAETLDLSNNCFKEFAISTPKYPRMRGLDTGYQELKCTNCCLTKLNHKMLEDVSKIADLKHNSLTVLTEDELNNIPYGLTVDLRYNNISKIQINSLPSTSNRQKRTNKISVILDFNPFICDCLMFQFTQNIRKENDGYWMRLPGLIVNVSLNNLFCDSPARVTNRRINSLKRKELICDVEHKDGCPQRCRCYRWSYNNTVAIDCNDKQLENFPVLNARLFNYFIILKLENNKLVTIPKIDKRFWLALTRLHLSHNQLISIENLEFGKNLSVLSVNNNRLRKFESPIISILSSDSNIGIKIAENPWICDCDLVPQRPLIYSKKVLDLNDVRCHFQDGDEIKSNFLTNVTGQEMCSSILVFPTEMNDLQIMITAIPLALFLVILVSSSFIVVYRYQSQIKLWLFIHAICMKLVSENSIDADKIYDAFVSYSSKDEDWVISVLVNGLEHGCPAYRLCLHERDWIGGEWIPDQIARSVEQSRRTIIVLTENFVKSLWGQIEFHAAYRQALNDKINRVLVVVPGEVPQLEGGHEELNSFITMNIYLKWDQPNFWNKLRCAMPRVTHQSAIQLHEIRL